MSEYRITSAREPLIQTPKDYKPDNNPDDNDVIELTGAKKAPQKTPREIMGFTYGDSSVTSDKPLYATLTETFAKKSDGKIDLEQFEEAALLDKFSNKDEYNILNFESESDDDATRFDNYDISVSRKDGSGEYTISVRNKAGDRRRVTINKKDENGEFKEVLRSEVFHDGSVLFRDKNFDGNQSYTFNSKGELTEHYDYNTRKTTKFSNGKVWKTDDGVKTDNIIVNRLEAIMEASEKRGGVTRGEVAEAVLMMNEDNIMEIYMDYFKKTGRDLKKDFERGINQKFFTADQVDDFRVYLNRCYLKFDVKNWSPTK